MSSPKPWLVPEVIADVSTYIFKAINILILGLIVINVHVSTRLGNIYILKKTNQPALVLLYYKNARPVCLLFKVLFKLLPLKWGAGKRIFPLLDVIQRLKCV